MAICNQSPNPGDSCLRLPGKRSDRVAVFSSSRVFRRITDLKSAIRRGVVCRWQRRRTAIRKLRALNDHYLRDIGLERSAIVSSVEKTV